MNNTAFGLATTTPLLQIRSFTTKRRVCTNRRTATMSLKNVLVCDVLDTLVADPFNNGMVQYFKFSSMKEFLQHKTPHAWVKFELGEYDETELAANFFKDSRPVDINEFKNFLLDTYRLLPGAAELLSELRAHQVQVHLCSNYGPWHTLIEQVVGLQSDYGAQWTFVSSQQGSRKPDSVAYQRTAKLARVHLSQCVLLDDRESNCEGAIAAGYRGAVRFNDVPQARRELAPFFGDWLLDDISRK